MKKFLLLAAALVAASAASLALRRQGAAAVCVLTVAAGRELSADADAAAVPKAEKETPATDRM